MSENNEVKEPLNKNNKVPKLRFDKFKNDNFNCDILSQIATLSKGNGLSKDDLSPDGNKCILYGELYTRYLGYIDTIISKTKTILSNPKLSKSGDIIMPLSGETPTDISNSAVVPEDNVILGGDLLVITPKKNIDPLFLSLYLSNCKKKEIAKKSCGISIIHSHKEDIAKLTIYYPSLAEQYYISTFLKKLTKKIDIVLKKIDVLKKYKKGVFLDTRKCSKKIALKTILSEVNIKTKYNNQYEILSSTAIGLFSQKEYFKHQVASGNNVGYKVIKKGQLLFSPQNLWLGNINLNNDFEIGMVSPSYKIYDIDNSINSSWLISMLKSQNMLYKYKQISEQGASVVRRNLDLSQFLEITLDIPNNQIQIGITLETIDKKINALSNLLMNLKNLKMHLLNEMFI